MLNNKEFDQFRKEANEALKALGNKYGFDLKVGKITYTQYDFKAILEAKAKEVMGVSYEQSQFEMYARAYGFDISDYGKKFDLGGVYYQICGFNPSKRLYKVLAKSMVDGKVYRFDSDMVLTRLGKETPKKTIKL